MSLTAATALTLALVPGLSAAQTAPAPRDTDAACPGEPDADFPDIAGSVHADNIRCLADLEVVQGKADGTYGPRSGVRRDQMASFVVRMVEGYTGQELPGASPDRFADVPSGNVHREAINKLAAGGWVQGRSGGGYDPAATVTRGQMARFIAGALSFLDDGDGTNRSAPPAASRSYFPDTTGSVFAADIDALAEQGIVGGFRDGTYRPGAPVLRDQMASFIARGLDHAIEVGLGGDGGPPLPPGFVQSSRFVTDVDALQVTDGTDFRRGEPGATGVVDLRLDRTNDTICYEIELRGVTGEYASPAASATHIHANTFGATGPPVVAFENPQPVDGMPGVRRSSGCVDATDPAFADGRADDPGTGFTVAQLEDDPSSYYLDSHTSDFLGGAVRGQLGATDVYDVSLSWHDEVDGDGLFGVGEPGASGDALLVLTDGTDPASGTAGDEVCAAIATDATGPFAGGPGAHLHEGARDVNGPVVVGFATPDDDSGRSVSCVTTFADGFVVADVPADVDDYYVNVHSEAFPAGAVRGQLPFGTRIEEGAVTSTFTVEGDPAQVVGGGEVGASATYELTLDSVHGIVCYEITTDGVSGGYASPATTATHIHEGPVGSAGPPRVAFADPVAVDPSDPDGVRVSSGCAVTPQFTATGDPDNGAGFDLAAIEDDPAAFYADIHTEDHPGGAVRGQFSPL